MAYQDAMRQQDMALDLEKWERAKRWEIDKMELASRLDFERTERVRQRKLDGIDNSLAQIDKEVQAGRMSDDEAYPLRLKLELNKSGVDAPTSLIPKEQGEEKKYGVEPHWMRFLNPEYEGTQQRQYAESKMSETIEGRTGTLPWYLDPDNVNTKAGIAAQYEAGIFLDDIDRADMAKGKQSDTMNPVIDISTEAEYDALPDGTHFVTPDGKKGIKGSGGR